MPAIRMRLRALLAAVLVVPMVASCANLGDGDRAVGRGELANELAEWVDRSADLTYTLDYQLAGGDTALITQAPPYIAYAYPGGKVIVAPEAVTSCEMRVGSPERCTLVAAPQTEAPHRTRVFENASQHGLVTGPMVIDLLKTVALDPDAVVAQTDTTITGLHATCVRVEGLANAAASSFDSCITAEGVVGSFTGTVHGHPVEMSLIRYRDSATGEAFDAPPAATLTDRRPRS